MQDLPVFQHPDLIVGPEGFSDAGVFRLRDDLLIVQSLDFFPPLVDDPFLFGQIAAANALSDLYAMGAQPTTAMNIVGFPDDQLELEILLQILRGGAEQVRRAGAVVVGGHTVRDQEIKYGLSVTGVVHPAGLVTNRQAQPGDQLLLTKPLGTGYVTTAAKAGKCPDDVLQAAVVSMCRLNRVASEAAVACGTHAMTDVTGFGLIGHASEMAAASGVSIELHLQQLPLLPGAVELGQQGFRTRANRSNRAYAEPMLRCEGELDPDRLELCFDAQTSGGLLISVPPAAVDALIRRVVECGEPAPSHVGQVSARGSAAVIVKP